MLDDKTIDELINSERFTENDLFFYSRLKARILRENASGEKSHKIYGALNLIVVSVFVVISLGLGFLFGYGAHDRLNDKHSVTARQIELMQFSSENNLTLISGTNEKLLLLK